jgi:uncharacterized damage-inducible protein DinB
MGHGKGMAPYALAIALTPAALRRIICDVPSHRHAEPVEPGRFTLVEMVAHLADFEEVWLDRIVIAYERPGSDVQGIDETERAILKHYSTRNLHHELDVFENRRRDTVEFVKSLAEDDWQKHFMHSGLGRMTICDQMTMLLGHDIYHLEQASQYLR